MLLVFFYVINTTVNEELKLIINLSLQEKRWWGGQGRGVGVGVNSKLGMSSRIQRMNCDHLPRPAYSCNL